VSPALAAIVNRLLQKKPENRFQSASELATALREARERPSVAAYRISNDAPTMPGAALPPRRTPLPDRTYTSIRDDEEERSRRSPWVIVTLVAMMLLATGVGYALFGRPMPDLGANIAVGDYTNLTDAQAQAAIVNAGLRVRTVKSPSDTVATNHVIRQNPEPGVRVDRNALVELVISNGKPMVGLQDVRSYTATDAQRLLQAQGFPVTTVRKFDNSAKDNVIDTLPKPGTQVRPGSRITLIVSNGPQPVEVPNFVGMSVDNARAQAARLGIALDTSQQAAVNGVPADTIALQDIAPGTKIDKNTQVHATVSTGVQSGIPPGTTTVAVPSVVNQPYQAAINALGSAQFTVAVHYQIQAASNGYIVAQEPPPNAQVPSGSTINVTLSVPGEVPDTNGMSITDATATLAASGYAIARTVYTTTAGAGGRVVGTDPQVGTNLAPGTPVTLVVNGAPPP
jgi:serine/threonine-protein kinase